jgi:hypothetical protein
MAISMGLSWCFRRASGRGVKKGIPVIKTGMPFLDPSGWCYGDLSMLLLLYIHCLDHFLGNILASDKQGI